MDNGVKKYTGGKSSDAFHLFCTVAPGTPSDFNGLEGEDIVIAAHDLKGTEYSGYSINLETQEAYYRSADGTLKLIANLQNIEHVNGHKQTQDELTGNEGNNILNGCGEKDILWGKEGEDTLIIEQGEMHGGKGIDNYVILENQQTHPVDVSIHDTTRETSNITFKPKDFSFSLVKDEATADQYNVKITLNSSDKGIHQTTVFISDAYHKYGDTLNLNGKYYFYTVDGLALEPTWPEIIEKNETGHFSFTPKFSGAYDVFKDFIHQNYLSNIPQNNVSITLQKRAEGDLIMVGEHSVFLDKNIDLQLYDTPFNDILTGDGEDNMILASAGGDDHLEGAEGSDHYMIISSENQNNGRTISINNKDTSRDPKDDFLHLYIPLADINNIETIGQDILLSSKHEPDKNLKIRFVNFLLDASYRHIRIIDGKNKFFRLQVDEQNKAYLVML